MPIPERTSRLPAAERFDVICFSLEPWNEVWRRNQHFASELLRQRQDLHLLFVEPPVDVTWTLRQGHRPHRSPLRPVGDTDRLHVMAPLKWLPRRLRPDGDRARFASVTDAARRLGFHRPVLWVNDYTYAPLLEATTWPVVYDVTDDWTLAGGKAGSAERERRNDARMLRIATEVVVCSPSLADSRGRERDVHLIPNGVDVEFLREPTARPDDLPGGRTVLYQGTLANGRIDLDLCLALCREIAGRATLVFVGPNSLPRDDTKALTDAGAVLLGGRPYERVPGYLQHADVLVVPHRIDPFTESLDPIKAREFQAVARPVVTTPVAGFRELGPPVVVADRAGFVGAVSTVLDGPAVPPGPGPLRHRPVSWAARASDFLAVLESAAGGGPVSGGA